MAEEIDDGDEPVFTFIDEIDATEYSIGTDIDSNQGCLKFHNEFGELSRFITDAAGIYELAQRLLRAYDKLEGID